MTIVSDAKKFIFIHIPATAGNSIDQALFHAAYPNKLLRDYHVRAKLNVYENTKYHKIIPHAFKHFEQHAPIFKIKNSISSLKFSSYYKFSVVRNPWGRVVSHYHYSQRSPKSNLYQVASTLDFNEYVNATRGYLESTVSYIPSQTYQLEIDGKIVMDFVAKYENLESHFKEICLKLKIQVELPRINYSARKKNYQTYYNTTSKKIVAKTFEVDIDNFKYSF